MTTGILGAWGPDSRGATRQWRIALESSRPRQSQRAHRELVNGRMGELVT